MVVAMVFVVNNNPSLKVQPSCRQGTINPMASCDPGADPEFEEGGGTHRVGLVRPCGARSAPNFSLRTYRLCAYYITSGSDVTG